VLRTLRGRLTALYVAVTAGMFLAFGLVVYAGVYLFLMRSIDQNLRQTAVLVLKQAGISNLEGRQSELEELPLSGDLIIQFWDSRGRLVSIYETAHHKDSPLRRKPLSMRGINSAVPLYATEQWGHYKVRVLSVPITVGSQRRGTLQIGTPLNQIHDMLRLLALVLFVVALIASLLAAAVSWFSVHAALAPLESVTAMADQITHADDLSRRLPVPRGAGTEVETLVRAFNSTLARLEALFAAQRRFIADVGHELRTPLTVIKGNAQWMQRIGEPHPEALQSIVDESERLNRLVEDLLLLARAESGRLPMRYERVALDEVVAEALRSAEVLARDKVNLQVTELEPLEICGDRDRIKQVLLNLLSNAVQYTPKGGKVWLEVRRGKNRAILSVSDTGPGIPPEDLPHVFERFYRADKARSRGKGFGLGLSIAYWIVKHHGGDIAVHSELGKGTTFTVSLPLWSEGCESE